MSTLLNWNNALNWAMQVTALGMFAWLATWVFRMHSANLRLRWYQVVLALVLVLPALVPPTRNTIVVEAGTSDGVTVVTGAVRPVAEGVSGLTLVLAVLGGGILLRLLWLGVGFVRLRQYRRASTPLIPVSSWGAEAELRISPSVSGPVTFGFLHPVVLLPESFETLGQAQKDAIICHEIMHVRRGDWLWMLGEELVRSVLWFHPAIWWLTAEIRLAREQAVDAEVVAIMRTRDEYVDALLTFANVVPTPFAAPVPGFIRRRHLKQRVINILKEVHMSRTRSVSTALAATATLAAFAWFTTTALPLRGQPQLITDTAGVSVNTNGAVLQHRIPVAYPRSSGGTQVGGMVTAEVRLDSDGNVTDARILTGPDELRKAVLQSVLSWHFAKSAGSVQQVSVTFQPQAAQPALAATAIERVAYPQISGGPPPPPSPFATTRTVKQIEIKGLPEEARQELAASLPVHAGDTLTPETSAKLMAAARKFDEHLTLSMQGQGTDGISVLIAPQGAGQVAMQPVSSGSVPGAIRVGGNVQQANLVTKVNPLYPPLAKAARVQGVVSFEATIDKEGKVSNLRLLSGPPLLVQSGMQAVQQWVYRPTLLNGNPVDVITTIDVNYTLAAEPPPPPPAQ